MKQLVHQKSGLTFTLRLENSSLHSSIMKCHILTGCKTSRTHTQIKMFTRSSTIFQKQFYSYLHFIFNFLKTRESHRSTTYLAGDVQDHASRNEWAKSKYLEFPVPILLHFDIFLVYHEVRTSLIPRSSHSCIRSRPGRTCFNLVTTIQWLSESATTACSKNTSTWYLSLVIFLTNFCIIDSRPILILWNSPSEHIGV